MSFYALIDELVHDTLQVSVPGFLPELALCGTIVLMLLVRMPRIGRRFSAFYIAAPGAVLALFLAAPWAHLAAGAKPPHVELFGGMLIYDALTVYFRGVLLLFGVLFLIFTRLSGIPDREDSADIYCLALGATLGMCLMASANHLFMVFLAVEMASVPSYALAGLLKGRRQSSEAALKYSVYGAGTAGVMLYGISLLAGGLGSLHLPTLAEQLASLSPEAFAERQTVLMMGGLMLLVGLAFKLSAVPFHFWCPDVFEGASAEVNAFLSVASKAAALALLVRVAVGFSQVPVPDASQVAAVPAAVQEAPGSATAFQLAAEARHVPSGAKGALDPLARARSYIVLLVGLLAAVTCTFGNLAAYAQTNMKRLLAYSTIAHAGYMMMPVAACVQVLHDEPPLAAKAIAALCVYVGAYLFMNLGAFAVVAFLRNAMRSEEIADYAGLIRRSPGVMICLSIILISLLGLPPLAGFAAKLVAFGSLLVDPAKYPFLLLLAVIGGINTVVSLFYYLRVVKIMALDPEPQSRLPFSFSLVTPEGVFIVLVTLPVVGLGVGWDALYRLSEAAARAILS